MGTPTQPAQSFPRASSGLWKALWGQQQAWCRQGGLTAPSPRTWIQVLTPRAWAGARWPSVKHKTGDRSAHLQWTWPRAQQTRPGPQEAEDGRRPWRVLLIPGFPPASLDLGHVSPVSSSCLGRACPLCFSRRSPASSEPQGHASVSRARWLSESPPLWRCPLSSAHGTPWWPWQLGQCGEVPNGVFLRAMVEGISGLSPLLSPGS